MYGQLNPCGGGDPIPLLKDKILIGRRSRCDITLEFPNVSSHHCELQLLNGYWRVTDLNSSNGVKVNGERCQARWLQPGDVLHVAKHLFKMEYEPVGDAPPPIDDGDGAEDIMGRSLMEKAGLERTHDIDEPPARPQRAAPVRTRPPLKLDDLEDEAFDYLSDDGKG